MEIQFTRDWAPVPADRRHKMKDSTPLNTLSNCIIFVVAPNDSILCLFHFYFCFLPPCEALCETTILCHTYSKCVHVQLYYNSIHGSNEFDNFVFYIWLSELISFFMSVHGDLFVWVRTTCAILKLVALM